MAFEVTDSGPGIPDRELEQVFERSVKSGGSSGAGLGLAIARSLVRAHAGEIGAASAPGGGASIRFRRPADG